MNEESYDSNSLKLSSTSSVKRRRGRVISREPATDYSSMETSKQNAVEGIKKPTEVEFEVITDNLEPERAKTLLSHDDMFKYGNADPSVPTGNVPCSGCGAHLHCQDSKMPGFVPVELFTNANSDDELRELQCQRCYIMKKYDVALKVSVSPEDYPKTIQHLRNKKAIIILVVDLVDFPGSVWPDIINLLGPDKRILLVGNKVDLLPADSKHYLRRIENSMQQTFMEKCARHHQEASKECGEHNWMPEIVSTVLISARTGFNIEVLVNQIYSCWSQINREVGGDIYLIGTTNVGKSSLFNMLIESDLCKIAAIDRVNKARISPVPGTTLNLLKFPVSRPDPSRLAQRYLRLQREKNVFRRAEAIRIEYLRKTRNRKYSILGYPVGRTFNYHRDKDNVFKSDVFNLNPMDHPGEERKPKPINPNDTIFVQSKWCYDTPGSVSSDQLINILTQEEIRKTIPEELPIQPRTFILNVGHSLFIGGLGRFDVLEGPPVPKEDTMPMKTDCKLLVTIFASDELPIHIVMTEDADSFYAEALQVDILAVPTTSNGKNMRRLDDFPDLEGDIMMVDGVGKDESSCDIVFSSAGWISCSPGVAQIFKVKAWTPGGRGLTIRDPPFLPEAVKLRGNRINRTPAYHYGRTFVPHQK